MQRYHDIDGVIKGAAGDYVLYSDIAPMLKEYNELRLEKIESEHSKYLYSRVHKICYDMHHPKREGSRHPLYVTYLTNIEGWCVVNDIVEAHVEGNWHGDSEYFHTSFPSSWLTMDPAMLPPHITSYINQLIEDEENKKNLVSDQVKKKRIQELKKELEKLEG